MALSGNAQEKIRALEKTDSFPLLHNELDTEKYTPDTTRIFFTQKNIVYQLYYNMGTMIRTADGTDIHQNTKRFFWLVQEKDSSYGYAFDEHRPGAQKWMHVDSTLTGHGMLRFQLDLSDKVKLRRLTSEREPATGMVHEVYVMNDATKKAKDTMYFSHSTRMRNIPFSLNKEIDEYTKMKVCYIKLVCGQQDVQSVKATMSPTAIITRFYEIPVSNSEDITKYIERFRLIGKRKTN